MAARYDCPSIGAPDPPRLRPKMIPWGLRQLGPSDPVHQPPALAPSGLRMRLNCPPEVTLITLRAAPRDAPRPHAIRMFLAAQSRARQSRLATWPGQVSGSVLRPEPIVTGTLLCVSALAGLGTAVLGPPEARPSGPMIRYQAARWPASANFPADPLAAIARGAPAWVNVMNRSSRRLDTPNLSYTRKR